MCYGVAFIVTEMGCNPPSKMLGVYYSKTLKTVHSGVFFLLF